MPPHSLDTSAPRGAAASVLSLSLLALSCVCSPALANAPAAPYTHDDVFLRAAIGGGWQGLTAPDLGKNLRAHGPTLSAEISVGGAVQPDLLLHVTVMHWAMVVPIFINGGVETGARGFGDASSLAIGIGGTYYFMPLNLYITASLGLGWLFMTKPPGYDPDTEGSTSFAGDIGWTFTLAVGKEWWVAETWAVGVQAYFQHSVFPEPGGLPVWGGPSAGVRMSLTYD